MMAAPPVSSRTLSLGVVYYSPLNRLCRWVPRTRDSNGPGNYVTFEYLDEPRGGFTLTHANLKHLRVLDDRGVQRAAAR